MLSRIRPRSCRRCLISNQRSTCTLGTGRTGQLSVVVLFAAVCGGSAETLMKEGKISIHLRASSAARDQSCNTARFS